MKKLAVLTILLLFAFSAVCLAAPSSSRMKSSPAPKTSTTQQAPATAPTSDYKPSAPANSYSNTAPKTAAPQQVQQPTTGGGFLRTLGMVGSGMLIGNLLGGMFGFGHSGMLASLIGILFNLVILVGIFMAGRFLWNKFKTSRMEANRRN